MTAGVVGVPTLLPAPTDRRPAATTPVAWKPSENIDVRDWVQIGRRLGTTTRCSQWWLGDWIRYGTARWGEKYKEASRITGYDVQSLKNFAYVAGSIEMYRRRDDLTWSHHAEVSSLASDEQDKWLALAATEKMSVADLRIELRAARRGSGESTPRAASSTGIATGVVMCPNCKHEFAPKS
jgi:hypothetical protein